MVKATDRSTVFLFKTPSALRQAIESKVAEILERYGITHNSIRAGILSLNHMNHEMLDDIASVLDVDFDGYLSDFSPYLTFNQVRKLISDGFSIGAHSIDHPHYTSIPLDDQIAQTIESVRIIQREFNLDYSVFAFPYSDSGVSKLFFRNVEQHVDLFFGSGPFMKDFKPNIFRRFWMENTPDSAERILARGYIESLLKVLVLHNNIKR